MASDANTMSNHLSHTSAASTNIAKFDEMAKIQFAIDFSQREVMPKLLQTALTTHFEVLIDFIDKFARCKVCTLRRVVTWFGKRCRDITQAIRQLQLSIM